MSIVGSIEIIGASGTNIGVDGKAFTEDAVPVVVGALHGITNCTPKEPEERANRMPVAEWTATDAQGQDVVVMLWEQPPFDETIVGKAIAAAIAQQQAEG